MNIRKTRQQITITKWDDCITLDINHKERKVHIWMTNNTGGQSLMTLTFTENGIQVKQ